MVKKRERLEIIRDILKVVQSKRKIKPTKLLYSSNLSPQMFKEYIGNLKDKNLLKEEKEKNKTYFILTKKGFQFLDEYRVIDNFINNFGLNF